MQVTNAPDNPRLFWLLEKPEDPQIEPHAGIKMVQSLVSLVYICEKKQKQNKTCCYIYYNDHVIRVIFYLDDHQLLQVQETPPTCFILSILTP